MLKDIFCKKCHYKTFSESKNRKVMCKCEDNSEEDTVVESLIEEISLGIALKKELLAVVKKLKKYGYSIEQIEEIIQGDK